MVVDNTIKLWDVATGRELRTFTGHPGGFNSVAFSADEKFLVSGRGDGTIKLWCMDGGELPASLIALDKADWAIATPRGLFDASPDARKLMHNVIGMEVVTLEQMKDLYYVPGLLGIFPNIPGLIA